MTKKKYRQIVAVPAQQKITVQRIAGDIIRIESGRQEASVLPMYIDVSVFNAADLAEEIRKLHESILSE